MSWFYTSAPARLHLQLSCRGVVPALLNWSADEDANDASVRLERSAADWRPTERSRGRLKLWAEGTLAAGSGTNSLRPLVALFTRQAELAAVIASIKVEELQLALALSPVLKALPALHTINLGGVGLSALPPELCRAASASLRRLVLRANRLVSLPPEIGLLTGVQLVDVSQNSITALPAELAQCTALVHLWLEDNAITRLLPTTFARLGGLQTLLLAYNPLDSLPQVVMLTRLGRLSIVDFEISGETVAHEATVGAAERGGRASAASPRSGGVAPTVLEADEGEGEAGTELGGGAGHGAGAGAGTPSAARGRAGSVGGARSGAAEEGGAARGGASGQTPQPDAAGAAADEAGILVESSFPVLSGNDALAVGCLRVRVAHVGTPARGGRVQRPHARRFFGGRGSERQQSVAEFVCLALRSTACQHPLVSSGLALLSRAEPSAAHECILREEGVLLMLQSMMLAEVDVVAQHACAVTCAVAAHAGPDASAMVDRGVGSTALQLLRSRRSPSVHASALELIGELGFASDGAATRLVAQRALFERLVEMCAAEGAAEHDDDGFDDDIDDLLGGGGGGGDDDDRPRGLGPRPPAGAPSGSAAGAESAASAPASPRARGASATQLAAEEPGARHESGATAHRLAILAPGEGARLRPSAHHSLPTTPSRSSVDGGALGGGRGRSSSVSERALRMRARTAAHVLQERALRTLGQLAFAPANVETMLGNARLMRALDAITARPAPRGDYGPAQPACHVLSPTLRSARGRWLGLGSMARTSSQDDVRALVLIEATRLAAPSATAAAAAAAGGGSSPLLIARDARRARAAVWHAAVHLLALLGQNGSVERAVGRGPRAPRRAADAAAALRVLSLDGGGMRALVTLCVLKRLEAISGHRIVELFDLIVGTSAGGIIAALLCHNLATLGECEQLFHTLGRRIFSLDQRADDGGSANGDSQPAGGGGGGGGGGAAVAAAAAAAADGASTPTTPVGPAAGSLDAAGGGGALPMGSAAGGSSSYGSGWSSWLGDVYKTSVEQLGGVRALLYGSKYGTGILDGLLMDTFHDGLLIDSSSRAVPRFCCVASLVSTVPASPHLFRNYVHTRARPAPAEAAAAEAEGGAGAGGGAGGRRMSDVGSVEGGEAGGADRLGARTDSSAPAAAPEPRRCASSASATSAAAAAAAAESSSAAAASAGGGDCKTHVWRAIRCTSAAPYYFDDVLIGGSRFQDGGLVANNPAVLGVQEAQRLWPGEPIGTLVSIGTGTGRARAREQPWSKMHMGSVLLEQATSTQLVADALDALAPLMPGVRYERLQPVDSRCEVGLDSTSPQELAAMLEATRDYLDSAPVRARMEALAEALVSGARVAAEGVVPGARGRLRGRRVVLFDATPAPAAGAAGAAAAHGASAAAAAAAAPHPAAAAAAAPSPVTAAICADLSTRGIAHRLLRADVTAARAEPGAATPAEHAGVPAATAAPREPAAPAPPAGAAAASAAAGPGWEALADALEADPEAGLVILCCARVRGGAGEGSDGGVVVRWAHRPVAYTAAQAAAELCPLQYSAAEPLDLVGLGGARARADARARRGAHGAGGLPSPVLLLAHELRFAMPACGGATADAAAAAAAADESTVRVYHELTPDRVGGLLSAAAVRARARAWRERVVLSRGLLPDSLVEALLDAGASAVICPHGSAPTGADEAHEAGVPAHEVAADDAEFARRALALIGLLRCGHGALAALASARLADVCAVHMPALGPPGGTEHNFSTHSHWSSRHHRHLPDRSRAASTAGSTIGLARDD